MDVSLTSDSLDRTLVQQVLYTPLLLAAVPVPSDSPPVWTLTCAGQKEHGIHKQRSHLSFVITFCLSNIQIPVYI
ncbi:hypothetical protein CEP52_014896 [Fusarium oligoseptatum]|uniref:Uncharacterized protein n=1 Tax=Fusarium oligoseptatum TaxID=2604345 RepID=A0A428SIA2_9HYPO|nr:hypothetical protein CEP52_014896 [Fusarium oligoseptatum]